jgi:hypothetical protein
MSLLGNPTIMHVEHSSDLPRTSSITLPDARVPASKGPLGDVRSFRGGTNETRYVGSFVCDKPMKTDR